MTSKYSGWGGLRFALAATAALALSILLPAIAQGAAPVITNANSNKWLESQTIGDGGGESDKVTVSLLVSHDPGRSVTGVKIDDDYDGTDNTTSKTFRATTLEQPNIVNGYDYSRVTYTFDASRSNSGLACPLIGSGTRRAQRTIRIRAVLDNGAETATANGTLDTIRYDCLSRDDAPVVTAIGAQSASSITPGQTVNFKFTADDSDAGLTTYRDFGGILYRARRLSDDQKTGTTKICWGPSDNTERDFNVTFPDRGRWVVEANLLDANDSCDPNGEPNSWWRLGSVDVNSAASSSPNISLNVPRPNYNGNATVTATVDDSADSGQGGVAQDIEWDLDENVGNGVDGFEAVSLGDVASGLTLPQRTRTIDTTGMTPGLHTVRARVGDNGALGGADNIRRTKIATTTFLVDSPPVVNDQALNAEAGVGKAVTLGATDADNDSLTYNITDLPDHGVLSGSGDNRTYTPNGNYAGPDSFTVEVNDGFGGIDTATISFQVAPQTQIDSGPNGPHDSPNASFTFSSPAGGATFECSFDSAPFSPCTSPQNFTGLAEDTYTFEVRATAAGNTDPTPASRTFTVDVTVPETTIDVDPGALTNDPTPTFEFSSNEPGSTFQCRVDSGSWATCPTPFTTANLGDNSHTFEVYAVDPAGNEDPTPSIHTFTVDTTPPDTTINSGPSGPTNTSAPQYTFSSGDNTATFECKIDGGGFNPCSSPWTTPTMPDGPHTIQIRAVDPAGNADPTPDSRSIIIDTTPPETTIDNGPGAYTNDDTPEFQFSSDDMGAGFQCRFDGGGWSSCSSPFSPGTPLSEDSHTFQVRAVDPAGNTDPTPASSTFTVDTSAPATTITSGPSGNTSDDTPTYEFSSDEAGSTFECSVDSGPFVPCTSPHTTASLTDGPHTFEVRATDLAGNTDPTPASRAITVDTQAPGTTIDSGPTGTINTDTATYEFSSGDGSAVFECRLDGGSWEECVSPQTFNGLDDGPHTFEVRAVDPAGNADPSPPAANFTVSTEAPETSIDSGPTGTINNTAATLTFSSDDNAATFECRLDGGSFAPCTSPQNLSGLSEGAHTFRVRAIDGDGNVDPTPAARSWTVDTTGPTSSIDSGPGGPTQNTDPSFEFSANEPGSTFECSLDAELFAPCTSPRAFSGLSEGSHTFKVRATDGAGNTGAAANRTFTVDTTAPDTTIDSGPTGTTNSTAATFQFSSTEGGSDFVCTLDGNAVSCSSPKSYTGLANGDHTFTVAARDAANNEDPTPASRTWTVSSTTPDTQITAGPGGTVLSHDVSFEFDSTASGATFECSLDNGPFTACTSPKAYTGLGVGEHTFSVRSTNGDGVTDPTPATRTFTVADAAAPNVKQPPKIDAVAGKLKLKKPKKKLQVATITCITGPCELSAATATVKAGKVKATLTPTAGTLAAGSTGAVMLKLKGKIFRAFKKKRKAKITLALEANSPVGSTKSTTKLKLKTKKKKKGKKG